MNRILQYVGRACPCCAAREYVAECVSVAESIEAAGGEAFEMIVPSVNGVTENGRTGIRLFVCWESEPIPLENASQDVARELREIADKLCLAADAVSDGGAI